MSQNLNSLRLTGWADYNDTGAGQAIPAAAWTQVTNDGAGAYTNKTYMPLGVEDVWDTTNNCFLFEDLAVGTSISLRYDFTATPTVNNTIIKVRFKWVAKDDSGTPLYTFYINKKLPTLDEGVGVVHDLMGGLPLTVDGEDQRRGDIFLEIYTNNATTINLNGFKVIIG